MNYTLLRTLPARNITFQRIIVDSSIGKTLETKMKQDNCHLLLVNKPY